jgi:hypothetical protein
MFHYKALGGDDKVAKGPELVLRLKADLVASFGGHKNKTATKSSSQKT